MSGEIWQFLLIGSVGIVVGLLWLFVIYLPKRTAEGDSDRAVKTTDGPKDPD